MSSEISKRYSMRGVSASKEEVHNAIAEAAGRARKGEGPTLLELRTYRYKGHSMSDPAKYRTKEELSAYKKRDPIEQVKDSVLKYKFATEEDLDKINKNVKFQVDESVKFSEESPFPSTDELFKDVYVQEAYPFVMD